MTLKTKLILSHLGAGLIGAAVGSVASYFFYREKLQREFDAKADEEEEYVRLRLDEMRKKYEGTDAESSETADEEPKSSSEIEKGPAFEAPDPAEAEKYHSVFGRSGLEKPDLQTLAGALGVPIPSEFDPDGPDQEEDPEAYEFSQAFTDDRLPLEMRSRVPYRISPGEYARGGVCHDKITVRYDVATGRVFDEDGDECEIDETIGEAWLETIENPNVDDVYYVRNEVQSADYEVMYDTGMGEFEE